MLTPVENTELRMLKIAISLSNLRRYAAAAAAAGLKPPSAILMILVYKLKVRVDRGRCYKNETLWVSSFDFFQYHVAVIVRVVKPVVQENIGATCGLIAGINRPDCVMLWLCMKWQILRVYWHLKYNKNDFLAIGSPAVHVHDGVQVHLFRFLQLTAVGLTFLFTPAALINCFPVKHLCSCTMQRQLACFNSNSWAVTMQMNNYSMTPFELEKV